MSCAEVRRMAQALARERGWAVFPMKAVIVDGALKKVPCRPRAEGGRGFYDASTDPNEIEWLWRHWPGAADRRPVRGSPAASPFSTSTSSTIAPAPGGAPTTSACP